MFGLSRSSRDVCSAIRSVVADLTCPASLRAIPAGVDLVFYTASADERSDDAYRAAYVDGLRNLLEALGARPPRRVLFTSSTAVYAQTNGEWVDESSATEPTHFSGRRLLAGERLLAASGIPAVTLRLGGIYGPSRTRLIDAARGGRPATRRGALRYVNRIHRDDCVGALAHLAVLRAPASVYVGVDEEPAREEDVLAWLAGRLGVPPAAGRAPAASSSGGGAGKRCSSERLVASGYRLRFPTFREGYEALLRGLGLVLALVAATPAGPPCGLEMRGANVAMARGSIAPQGAFHRQVTNRRLLRDRTVQDARFSFRFAPPAC